MSAPTMTNHDGRIRLAIMALAPCRFEYDVLPLKAALEDYRDRGRPVGDFLTALLSNDLGAACAHADDTNLWLLPIYRAFLYNEFPMVTHGSPEKVAAWLAAFRPSAEVGQ